MFAARDSARQARNASAIVQFTENDSAPCFTTNIDGVIEHRNKAARERFGVSEQTDETLVRCLRDLFANPSAVLLRLQNRAEACGSTREAPPG
jgi:two-component system cell cycle sensor histidine kinase/response regulator CckA